jgi:uncharacterized membrane protein
MYIFHGDFVPSFFGEKISVINMVGAFIIVVGIALMSN